MGEVRRQKRVQTFGRKKNAVAVALCTEGKGMIKVNGSPLHLLKPEAMRIKACESILVLGKQKPENKLFYLYFNSSFTTLYASYTSSPPFLLGFRV